MLASTQHYLMDCCQIFTVSVATNLSRQWTEILIFTFKCHFHLCQEHDTIPCKHPQEMVHSLSANKEKNCPRNEEK